MILRDTAPPPTIAVCRPRTAALCRGPLWTPDDIALARTLFTVWAARTGRELRAVPVTELTADELIEFWADDQLGDPIEAPVCGRLA